MTYTDAYIEELFRRLDTVKQQLSQIIASYMQCQAVMSRVASQLDLLSDHALISGRSATAQRLADLSSALREHLERSDGDAA